MKHVFIVNKISGKGCAYNNINNIKEIAEQKGLKYVIEVTEYPGHCKELVEKYNDESDVIFYSVGGDGTFLDVINASSPNHLIGVIPCGSGNDFYRYFGGENTDYRKLIEDTIDAEPIKVDIGKSDRYKFANTTSIGMDAKINYDASKFIRKTILNKGMSYGLSILINCLLINTLDIKVFIDNVDYSGKYFIIAIMNGKYYGNGVKAAPNAEVDDGYFDIVLFKKMNRFKAYKTLIKYLNGKASVKDGVTIIKCKNIVIDSINDMHCQSDGENYITKHLNCKIIEKSLNLKVAKSQSF